MNIEYPILIDKNLLKLKTEFYLSKAIISNKTLIFYLWEK